jgi:hypothetical protein
MDFKEEIKTLLIIKFLKMKEKQNLKQVKQIEKQSNVARFHRFAVCD